MPSRVGTRSSSGDGAATVCMKVSRVVMRDTSNVELGHETQRMGGGGGLDAG